MLLTIFTIGDGAYAVDAASLIEVLPLVHIEPMPQAPAMIAGMANYHGTPLVVVDLHRLVGRASAPTRLSTRILLVQHGSTRVGLLAAGVTGTVKLDPAAFKADADAAAQSAAFRDPAWLGPRAVYGAGFVQRVEIAPLLERIGAAA